MTRATRTAEYTGATTLCLYLAFELGSNEWKLGVHDRARGHAASAHGGGGGSAPTASRAADLEAGTHAGGEPDERPAREPGPLAAAGHRRRGRGEDDAPVGWLARARGAAGPVGAGMGARAIPTHADSRVGTRTPARDCPRARRGHRQSPAAAPPARGRAERRVGLCERVLRVATVPEPQGGRGGGGAHADAVPKWRRTSGTRDQQGGKSAHPGIEGAPMRLIGLAVVLSLTLTPLAAVEAQAGKVYQIGFLSLPSAADTPELVAAFRHGLRDLGYEEGKNISIEYRWAEGRDDRLPALAADLVRLKVDVIVASATPPAKAAQGATDRIPTVFIAVADPIGVGLVANLARPGRNITGFTTTHAELCAKRLEFLKTAVPHLTLVAVLLN